jgi:RNA polymerase sigma-70 factor (ECF subfamily)
MNPEEPTPPRGADRPLEERRDDSLIPFLQAGQREAVAELERRYGEALRRRCADLLGDSAQAEDVVQDLMMQCCKADEARLPEHELRAWMYRVARNRCLDELRKRKVRAARPVDDGTPSQPALMPVDPITSPSGRVLKRERMFVLRDMIDAFPDDLREVLILRYFENRSREEIGRELGLSESVVKARLVKAVAKLRRHLVDLREDSVG